MPFSPGMTLEVRTTGSDTNGGGFKAGASGTDWSQQNTPQYAVTDLATNNTATVTSATANFGPDVVGNMCYIEGGTGGITGGWYEILSRTNSTTIGLDRATGLTTGTGATLNIGGALASPGLAAQLMNSNGMRAWAKAGTYPITTSTPGANGPIATVSSTSMAMIGYDATRGDNTGNRPVMSWNAAAPGATSYCITLTGGHATAMQLIANFSAEGNDVANVSGFRSSWRSSYVVNCHATECSQSGQTGFLVENVASSVAIGCAVGISLNDGQAIAYRSAAVACDFGIVGNGGNVVECLATGCTDYGMNSATYGRFVNCTSDGNGQEGFVGAAANFVNCISTNNGAQGFATETASISLIGCADFNNLARTGGTVVCDINPITLTADPYVNAATQDYRPNNTEGGGALLRAAGLGMPSQTNHFDIGALQSEPSGGGSAVLLFGNIRGNFQ